MANIWPTNDGWAEAHWPRHQAFGWFTAPIDLRPGHILEFRGPAGPIIGAVQHADETWVVVLICPDRHRAVDAALQHEFVERSH